MNNTKQILERLQDRLSGISEISFPHPISIAMQYDDWQLIIRALQFRQAKLALMTEDELDAETDRAGHNPRMDIRDED